MLSLRLSPNIEHKLNEIAKVEERTKSDIVKEAIEAYLQTRQNSPSAYQLAEQYFDKINTQRGDGSVQHKKYITQAMKLKR